MEVEQKVKGCGICFKNALAEVTGAYSTTSLPQLQEAVLEGAQQIAL